ncbi:flavodoxin domain-containing protein [Toxoplasma gondii MAS]|uniref:Flavodoxin domain-containing protein n=3 Tax=Toxoplasma gondii TaxID=5811 RepID=A0A086QDP4_TOXGO|nr:flavodoxin domain-containing protein [Toxoplasma gondii MAS]PUA90785.1 flavodoxin domain-containing protein [Toxoplasma gondii TgCATBr9]
MAARRRGRRTGKRDSAHASGIEAGQVPAEEMFQDQKEEENANKPGESNLLPSPRDTYVSLVSSGSPSPSSSSSPPLFSSSSPSSASLPAPALSSPSPLSFFSPSSSSVSCSAPLYVAFASQTGTAAEAARDLGRELLLLWKDKAGHKTSSSSTSSSSFPPPAVVRVDDLLLLLPALRRCSASTAPSPVEANPLSFAAFAQREEAVVVFVVSTTGYGEMPENAQKFWRLLLKASLPSDFLSSLKFAVFGLGDRLYKQFNFAARKLQMRLKQLGAQEVYRIGLGDDQHDFGYEGEFDPWLSGLLPSLVSLYSPSSSLSVSSSSSFSSLSEAKQLPPSLYSVRVLPDKDETDENRDLREEKQEENMTKREEERQKRAEEREGVLLASPLMKEIYEKGICEERGEHGAQRGSDIFGRVVSNKRLTPVSHFQKIHLLQLAVPRRSMRAALALSRGQALQEKEESASDDEVEETLFTPGSVCSISPLLPPRLTLAFLDALNLPVHARLQLRRGDAPAVLTGEEHREETGENTGEEAQENQKRHEQQTDVVVKALDLFTQVVDVSGRPSRFLLKLLATWIPHPLLKEKLLFLSSRSLEAKDEFCAYCRDERRTIAEVCWDFCCNADRSSPENGSDSSSSSASSSSSSSSASGSSASSSLSSPPLSDIVSALPLIQRRKYSIANYVFLPRSEESKRRRGETEREKRQNETRETENLVSCAGDASRAQNAKGVRWLMASPFLLRMHAPGLFLWLSAESRARFMDTLVSAEESREESSQDDVVVDICFSVVESETVSLRRCLGICSSFLAELPVGSLLPFSIEASKFPASFFDLKTRLILISPGTGVAPVRSLIQQRHAAWLSESAGKRVDANTRAAVSSFSGEKAGRRKDGDATHSERDLLFLGFRHERADFLFAEEWKTFLPWLDVRVAFSRDGVYRHLGAEPEGAAGSTARRIRDKTKIYVQDLLEEARDQVASLLIESDAAVLICGRAHPMPSQVEETLVEILETSRGFSTDAARRFLADKKRRKRYVCDTWG